MSGDNHNQAGHARQKFSPGGLIPGEGQTVHLRRLGIDEDGFTLYSINGGKPERIYTADDARKFRGEVSS